MTKKDYIKIAAVIKARLDAGEYSGTVHWFAMDFAAMFKADNAKFDNAKFMKACGF